MAKAQCEHHVLETFGERGLVVRPTYIVGPGDTTDRFPYWPVRLERGGEVLAPGRRDDPVQLIDVRDLAEFMPSPTGTPVLRPRHEQAMQRSGAYTRRRDSTRTVLPDFHPTS